MRREVLQLLAVWAGLMLLLGATVMVTFSPLGAMRMPASLAIAGVKAALVFWVFMHLREQPPLTRVIALAAFGWLAWLIVITSLEASSRGWLGA